MGVSNSRCVKLWLTSHSLVCSEPGASYNRSQSAVTVFVTMYSGNLMKWRIKVTASLILSMVPFGIGISQDKAANPQELLKNGRTGLPGLQPNNEILLPNGWSLTPQGTQVPLGDFPVRIEIDPSGKFAVVLHCGYGDHEVRVISLETSQQISSARIDQSFYGLSFINDGKQLAISGGEDEKVYVFPFADGYLGKPSVLTVGAKEDKFVVSGLATSGNELLVCGLLANEMKIIDGMTGELRKRVKFADEAYPYTAIVDEVNGFAYVSLWGKSQVVKVKIVTGEIVATIPTLSHPTEMVLLDRGKYLYVTCSNQNGVVLIDTATGEQKEVLSTALYAKASNGSTPMSLCVSPDTNVLLVANADNNNLAVFDIRERGKSSSLGFIPVGWYPTSVRMAQEGNAILVANGKGLTSRTNVHGANPNLQPPKTVREYIGGLMQGALSIIDTPNPAEMAKMTRLAFENTPLNEKETPNAIEVSKDNPIPTLVGQASPIKHCVYIIKENRTYDQVFGDIPKGNGDPSLCIFPQLVTPNHHALADQYVLLDNFYVESEVSADGHEWTMAAYATDFVEKTWPLTYRGGRGKLKYPAEGKFKIAEPSSGYFWDKCKEKNVSYFSFGEFVDNGPTINDPSITQIEALQGHYDPRFRSYDLDYPDVLRAKRFLEKWSEFESAGSLPQFIVMRLPNDHTYGTRAGKPTPTAMVADNDLALGMIIEGLSNSQSWSKTAVFVVEDDAQNGADHVDAHRTVALVVSPYSRMGSVDSTLYSTSSMLRTMGLILGLDPMTQFDAAATPMYRSFTSKPDLTPYVSLPANVDLKEVNLATAWGSKLSEQMDLSKEDAADDLLFGDIVWRSVKGADHPMPPPVRAGYVFREVED
jgi:DNA-binding beta-propeller fold protein YncE